MITPPFQDTRPSKRSIVYGTLWCLSRGLIVGSTIASGLFLATFAAHLLFRG